MNKLVLQKRNIHYLHTEWNFHVDILEGFAYTI
jgi:hypothetical protein